VFCCCSRILQRQNFEVTNPFKRQLNGKGSRHGESERNEVPVTHIDFPAREYQPLGEETNIDEDET